MADQTRETDVESIIFCYRIGLTFTAVWTKPKDQWTAAIPDHMKMTFGFNTPPNFCGGAELLRDDQIADAVRGKIREKAEWQKRTGQYVPMTVTARQEREKGRGKKKWGK